jgi:aryl-alcohol dehydrogenase-like predicted oxidoreductase
MLMRPLFPGGPEVSAIGLSLSAPPTASLPLHRLAVIAPESADPIASGEDTLAAQIKTALALGINFVDSDWITAGGHAQEVLGRVLKGHEAALIASKGGPRLTFHGGLTIDNSRANLMNQSIDSLFRLKRQRVALFQVHWPDATPPEQTARGLQDILHAGQADFVGVCNYSLEQTQALATQIRLHTVQAPLNLLNRRSLDGLLPWCVANGVGFLASDPLLSGLLAGHFSGDEEFTEGDRDEYFAAPRFQKAVQFVRELAALSPRPPAQLAVAWCLAQGASCVLCPASEVAALAPAAELSLDAALLHRIDDLARSHGLLKP